MNEIEGRAEPTLQEETGELDAHIPVPARHTPALYLIRNANCFELFDVGEDAVHVAEADDDLGHAEQEGLDPIPHQLAVKLELIVGPADLGARFELDPVDGLSWCLGLFVPD